MFESRLIALSHEDGDRLELRAPAVGFWRGGPTAGALVKPGDGLGEFEILGVLHRLEAPADAWGLVLPATEDTALGDDRARRPLAHGQCMLVLDRSAELAAGVAEVGSRPTQSAASDAGELVFRAPTSGRFYSRPGPDKPPFVAVGDSIEIGTTICLLEVMKTFNRVTYGGDGLPERARVTAIVPAEEDDLAAGDIILRLE